MKTTIFDLIEQTDKLITLHMKQHQLMNRPHMMGTPIFDPTDTKEDRKFAANLNAKKRKASVLPVLEKYYQNNPHLCTNLK